MLSHNVWKRVWAQRWAVSCPGTSKPKVISIRISMYLTSVWNFTSKKWAARRPGTITAKTQQQIKQMSSLYRSALIHKQNLPHRFSQLFKTWRVWAAREVVRPARLEGSVQHRAADWLSLSLNPEFEKRCRRIQSISICLLEVGDKIDFVANFCPIVENQSRLLCDWRGKAAMRG